MNSKIVTQLTRSAANLRLAIDILRKSPNADHDEIVAAYEAFMAVLNSKR